MRSRPWIGVPLCAVLVAALISPSAQAQRRSDPGLARSSSCRDSVWGCSQSESSTSDPREPRRPHYDRLVTQARRALSSLRSTSSAAGAELIKEALQQLHDAVSLLPEEPEAHGLLGQLELERGHPIAAAVSLRRAEDLYTQLRTSDKSPLVPQPALERTDPSLALALALLHAQEGDLSGALLRYQRLYDHAAHSPRLLYRMADVLMALGQLEDATALYERGCLSLRGPDVATVDISRACLGYAVALDRAERTIPAALWRKARTADRGPKAADLLDFVSEWEREYHRALLHAGCERRACLQRYLQGAAGQAPASFRRRAELQLQRGREQSCPALP